MSRSKIVLIISLAILEVLIVFAFIRPMVTSTDNYSEIQRSQLLEREGEWIIDFDIINHEGRDQNYVITVAFDGKQCRECVMVPDGGIYTYMFHVFPDEVPEGEVCCTICKEGEDTPLEEVTYYLK